MIVLKSYSKLEDLGYDTHDIFNLMEILWVKNTDIMLFAMLAIG